MPAFLHKLQSEVEFNGLASDPLTNKYSEVTSVKVVYDLRTEQLYFINSANYKFHYEFCQAEIDEQIYLGKFNTDNYTEDSPDRRYLLGNINYFKHINTYSLELSPSDYMSVELIERLMKEIKTQVYFKDNFSLMLSTQRLTSLQTQFSKSIKFLTQEEIYAKMESQIVVTGEAIGNLRFVSDLKSELTSLRRTDIIIIKETPLILPNVAGVIVAEFQTPLSHLSILGKNRGIPVIALKNVFSTEDLLALKNEKVEFVVTANQYSILKTTKVPKSAVINKNSVVLKSNLEVDSIIAIANLSRHSEYYMGNKANNFGFLYALSLEAKFKTPESAFAIPFYFYNAHFVKSGADLLLKDLIANPDKFKDPIALKSQLNLIRKTIKDFPIDATFLKSVETKIKSLGDYKRMRFRSSTNAEDAKGFSGAGLYSSKTGELDNPEKSIEKAIKKVWASLWSEAAFMEREYFNIDQSTVFMGILAHRSFPNEEVNGVVITKNLYRKDYLGFVVNAQLGNESVVKPSPNVICDQFICYPKSNLNIQQDEIVIDIISRSSLNKGKLVMTETEIQFLADEMDKIKLAFYRRFGRKYLYEDFGLDIEFKLESKTRQLYIKQFRLYND
jgi:phage host-nuclease inhibitor protein Gam